MYNLPIEILEAVKAHHKLNNGIHIQNAEIEYNELNEVYVSGFDNVSIKNGSGVDLIFCFDNAF